MQLVRNFPVLPMWVHLSFLIQPTSGERFAPLGSLTQVEESKQTPSLVWRFQNIKSAEISILRFPVPPPVGDIINISPFALGSNLTSEAIDKVNVKGSRKGILEG